MKKKDKFAQDHAEYTLDVFENFRFDFYILNRIRTLKNELQKEFFENHLKSNIFPTVLQLIAGYRRDGAVIVISTSSMRYLAEPVARFINADHLLATEGQKIEDYYTGAVVEPPNYGIGKKIKFSTLLSYYPNKFEKTIFYSDSFHDVLLLEAVDMPIAVNPDDRLRAHAQRKGWKIMNFDGNEAKHGYNNKLFAVKSVADPLSKKAEVEPRNLKVSETDIRPHSKL